MRDYTRWSTEVKESALNLRQQGLTLREISSELGVPHQTLNNWFPGNRQCYICARSCKSFVKHQNSLCSSCGDDAEKLKQFIFDHYDWSECLCCGEDHMPYLTIGHLDNDGYRHKSHLDSKRRLTGARLIKSIIHSDFTCEFRLGPLCCNCQVGCQDNPDPRHRGLNYE